jgi:hypothetical protein
MLNTDQGRNSLIRSAMKCGPLSERKTLMSLIDYIRMLMYDTQIVRNSRRLNHYVLNSCRDNSQKISSVKLYPLLANIFDFLSGK